MKSLIICGVLAIVVMGICVGGILYVDHATQEIEKQLHTCIYWANQQDFQQAKQALLAAQTTWKQRRLILMMYTDQEILDEIDDHLEHMSALADHHKDEFVPTAVLCLCKCQELHNRESISFDSWF